MSNHYKKNKIKLETVAVNIAVHQQNNQNEKYMGTNVYTHFYLMVKT